jgi:tetratricopeptide (TPR) repeat protein
MAIDDRPTVTRFRSLLALLALVAAFAAGAPATAADVRTLYGDALALARAGDLDAAETRLHAVLGADKQHARSRILLGLIGDRREVRIDADAFAQVLDGIARARARDRKAAREAFEAALALQPEYPVALRELATVLRMQGDNDGAIALYERALAVDPDDPIAESSLGLALGWAGRHDAAALHFEKAIHLDPDFKPAVHNLGWSLEAMGREAEARSQYVRALELDPDSEITLANLLSDSDAPDGRSSDPEAITELVDSIRTGDTRTRRNAVAVLAHTPEFGPATLPLLRHREAMVRVAAVNVFAKAPYAGAVGPLVELLASDPDFAVRGEAASALARAADPRASAALVRAMGADPDEQVRSMSAWALACHPGCATARALRAAQRDRIVLVRHHASKSVARLGGGAAPADPRAPDPWLAKVCAGETTPLP